ncbi:hypothetical protein HNQ07_003153 [Deinococcus metalli]|uniref:DUF4260 family protein n=1 Tax=Deinococcus metalli TaxID=1141878 RepID=A0A7W8KJF1_9DEIO|nr:DUF4260 domain-containing protein [Deinococcus metalli]MBB5377654.1 hypothetical protein [Deinococcus metalli]GHF52326.1 hypothetical protein GCM10017781_30810 [Deinococcus metalli]
MTNAAARPSRHVPARLSLQHPLGLLRVEGLALCILSAAAFLHEGGHWGYLFLGFLADLTFVGYVAGPRVGAALYNAVHSTVLPIALTAAGLLLNQPLATLSGLVMLAHIGFDRAAGYGLKFPDAFGHTHLDA